MGEESGEEKEDRCNMTLETARRIVDEGTPNKEAEAVVRGGMTICETKSDGNRVYQWIKVIPTTNDSESSIELALEKYQNRKQKRPGQKREEPVLHEPETSPTSVVSIHKEDRTQPSQPALLERIKKRAKDLWKEIDSIVVE